MLICGAKMTKIKKFEAQKLISNKKDLGDLLVKYKSAQKKEELQKSFRHVAFPTMRRVFSGLIANEIVAVQPMTLPSGLLFFMDTMYGTNSSASLEQKQPVDEPKNRNKEADFFFEYDGDRKY